MQKTTNYELNKPEAVDQYNIEHFNDNADTIDAQMKANADAISSLDSAAMKKANNLSDLDNKSTAMTNIIDSYTAATDANVNNDNIEVMTRKVETGNVITWYKTKFSSFWNYIKGKAASWFGITVTESEGSITGRVFNGDVSGGVETATKLSNVRYINGMGFDGSQNVSCFCEESGGVASGVFSVYTYQSSSQSSENPFSIVRGARISVKFLMASLNTGSYEIKLSVNDGTAIRIALLNGALPTPQEAAGLWFTNDLIDFIFDGTYWRIYPKDPTPIGTIRAFGGTTAPLGYLICNYDEKQTAQYPKLQAVIEDKYGSASSGKFRLPDLREASLVGAGRSSKTSYHITTTSGGNTTTGMSVGQFKDDALQGHSHSVQTYNTSLRDGSGSYYVPSSASASGTNTISSDGSNGTPRTENTTHGKIVGVTYCIKYI